MLYSVRSERQLCEQLEYNSEHRDEYEEQNELLFRWFLDMDMLEPAIVGAYNLRRYVRR